MNNYRHSLCAPVMLGMLALGLMLPTRSTAATAPRVTTLTSSNVTATSATLKGSVTPGNASTTAWFEWGPGNAFKFFTSPTNPGSGSSPVSFSGSATGLVAGTIYRSRAVASNSLGVVRGVSIPFGAPIVTLNGANPQTNAQFEPFVDAGATAAAPPIALSVGDRHNLALKADGHIAAWGANDEGQTNVPSSATNIIAIAAGYGHNLALRASGSVIAWGTNVLDRTTVPPEAASGVMAIAAGDLHSLALKTNGTVIAWGADLAGESTAPDEATNVVAIAGGFAFSLALRADGTVVGWGDDSYGQVTGPVAEATNIIAIAAGYSHTLTLRADGTVQVWGGDTAELADIPADATNIVAIAAGDYHNLALKADGTVIGWGLNDFAEITIPAGVSNIVAIGAGFGQSQAMRANGEILGWGSNNAGQTNTPSNLVASIAVGVSGAVNTSLSGTYPLLYSATNIIGFAGTATRTVIVPGAGAPVISSCGMLGNGSFQLDFDYVPGTNCTVIATTNLAQPATNWTVLGQATENPAGHYQFTDPAATGFARRFYRLRLP